MLNEYENSETGDIVSNISYEECHEYWENEENTVHKDVSDVMMSEIADHVADRLELDSEDSLLTIGCGDGYIDRFLIPKVGAFYAIDFSSQKLHEARKRNPKGIYHQCSFLDSYYDLFQDLAINKIYSYSVMQYCRPEDVVLFIKNQIKCLDMTRVCRIAHLDVPEISRAEKTDDKTVSLWKKNGIYDKDGSYWHDLYSEKKEIEQIKEVKYVEIINAHYWKDRLDLIIDINR